MSSRTLKVVLLTWLLLLVFLVKGGSVNYKPISWLGGLSSILYTVLNMRPFPNPWELWLEWWVRAIWLAIWIPHSIYHLCFVMFSYLAPLLIAGRCFVPMATPQWAWLTLLSRGQSVPITCFLCRQRWAQCQVHCTSGAGRIELKCAAVNYFVRYLCIVNDPFFILK